jgi:hypothetical protein
MEAETPICWVNTFITWSAVELQLLSSERFNKQVFVIMDFHGYELAYITSCGDAVMHYPVWRRVRLLPP